MKLYVLLATTIFFLFSIQCFAMNPLDGTWYFSNGPEFPGADGKLEPHGDERFTLRYDFRGGGNYVAAYCDLASPLPLKSVSFRLLKPEEATITIRVTDSGGQTFQKSFYYDSLGFKDIVVTMGQWAASWGGVNDGVLRMPIRTFGILVEKQGLSQPIGSIAFSSVQYEIAPADDKGIQMGTATEATLSYLVTDFGPECVLAKTIQDRLHGRVWTINFTDRTSDAMTGSLSLFYKPTTLSFRVRASAPGATLVFRIGAHFQTFTRTIGRFDGTDQTFTFSLPPEGWEASGAAHTTLHYPLRITGITIEKNECKAETLKVTLGELTCETTVPPGKAITLMSSLQAGLPQEGLRPFTLLCSGWNLNTKEASGQIHLTILNWDGDLLHENRIPMVLSGGGRRHTIEYQFTLPSSWRYIESRCQFVNGSPIVPETLSTFTASLTEEGYEELVPNPDGSLCPESPWGMGVYLYRYPNTAIGHAQMDRAAALAAAAGVKWTREEFNYGMIETAPGVYDFSFFDVLVDTAHRHGISIYALLSYWSPFIENPYSEEGINAYCHYARATVARYKGRINHWEIYNEPNIFFWEGPKELYPVLLKRAYETIKAEDPEAQVLAISTAGIDKSFIRMVVESGAPFDALTIHPYRSQLLEKNFVRELQQAAKVVDHRPVWITEMGWSTQLNGGKTEREQAQLLARAYLAAGGAGIRNMGWYNFRNDGEDPFYNEANFGVLHLDMRPKAAYRALATVCRTLAISNGKTLAWIKGGEGKEGIFGLTNGIHTALWSSSGAAAISFVVAHGDKPAVINLMGEPILPEENHHEKQKAEQNPDNDSKGTASPIKKYLTVNVRQGDPLFVVNAVVEITNVETLQDSAVPDAPLVF